MQQELDVGDTYLMLVTIFQHRKQPILDHKVIPA